MSQRSTKRSHKAETYVWVPITPGGTACPWLASATEDEAWAALLIDAAQMPYKTREGFEKRGYTVERWPAGMI